MKFGLFTVSVPDYTPDQTMEIAARLGYDGLEWRVVEDNGDKSNPTFWSGNRTSMSAQEVIDRADELKEKMAKHGLEMPSLGTYIGCADLDVVELHMKATVAVGATNLRVSAGGFGPDSEPYPKLVAQAKVQYAKVADLAAQYGVRAVIETHMGQLGPSITKARAILDGLDPKHVGIMYDPGNMVSEGNEVYSMALDVAGEYLAEVHAKNVKYVAGEADEHGQVIWQSVSCPVREGIVNWPKLIAELKTRGYDGWFFFEDFSTDAPLDQRLEENINWFRQISS